MGGDEHTVSVLTKLVDRHNQQRTTQSTANDRYEFRWDISTAPVSDAGADADWILVGDGGDAIRPLVDLLTARGHRHRVLGLPSSDAEESELADALRAAAAHSAALRILDVAALSASAPSMRSLLRMHHDVLGGTRRLLRAAAAADLRAPTWVVTRGAQRVTHADSVSPDQTCLWGFGRAAALELPHVWGGLADLGDGGTAEWSELVDRISAPAGTAAREDQIALRDRTVYVPRLVRRVAQPSGTPLSVRGDATYLVTGGLGAIGLEIAGHLAALGAKHLILTSRRAPDDAVAQRIAALGDQHVCVAPGAHRRRGATRQPAGVRAALDPPQGALPGGPRRRPLLPR